MNTSDSNLLNFNLLVLLQIGDTPKVIQMNRLEAFELWLYHRMLKINWTYRITNVEVKRRIRKDREIVHTVKKRNLRYL
ncbi:hypothetical protein HUJ04_001507 [Dendroctonus ponderosae]|nr:hypothetical protein HUJ04_001507 [Dendroctonus ponderosae]